MNAEVVHIQCNNNVKPLQVGNKIFKSAYDWNLSEKDLEKAARELGETEDKKVEGLRQLKEKLSNESNVKYRQDDFYLLRFLRVRKYDVERAHRNIKLFSETKKKLANLFVLTPALKSAQELNCFTALPYTDEEGSVMFWMSLDRWNAHEWTFEEMIQTSTTVADIVSMNPTSQINGVIAIHDYKGISMKHVTGLLWNGRLREMFSIIQNGYPWRVKKVILLNTNVLVRLLYNVVKPLLHKKIRERCFFLGSDITELHQHVDPAVLPKKLKGYLEDEDCNMSQHVFNNLAYLKYERSFIFD